MCTSPLRIQRKWDPEKASLLSRFIPFGVPTEAVNDCMPTKYRSDIVPCGKCFECLKQKQNDMAFRCVREAELYGSMYFLTLTYAPEHLPFAGTYMLVDKSTGEIFYDGKPTIIKEGEVLDDLRLRYTFESPNSEPIYYELNIDNPYDLPCIDDRFEYYLVCTPSLYRRQVRLWLKRSRVRYKRKFGRKLSRFSYVIVGEMGSKRCRPHYHLGIFGLSKEEIYWLAYQWEYGSFDLRCVNQVNKDGSSGFVGASKYIGKYLSKGVLDCKSVLDGKAEKPRVCMSISFGTKPFDDKVMSFYRCEDVFGKYDINRLQFADGRLMSFEDIKSLDSMLKDRTFYEIQNNRFHLPKLLLKKLWYVPTKEKKLVPSALQIVRRCFIQSNFLDDYFAKCRECGNVPSFQEAMSFIEYFNNSELVVNANKDASIKASMLNFYLRSKF